MNEKQTNTQSTVRPTKKQRELLEFIEAFIGEHGYSPSYREIMSGLNYTSVATVALHVNNLIKRGHLIKREHSARSLEVVQEGVSQASAVKTNEVKPGEEKWLVDKVEYFLAQAEAAPQLDALLLDSVHILIGALKVLGLEGAAQSFAPRIAKIKEKATAEA